MKLHRQVKLHGTSTKGMPPIQVSETIDGYYVIDDGVTRAYRIA